MNQLLNSINYPALIKSLISASMITITIYILYKYLTLDKKLNLRLEKLNISSKISRKMYENLNSLLDEAKHNDSKYNEYLDQVYMYKMWNFKKFVSDKRSDNFKNIDLYIEKYFEYFWTKNRFHVERNVIPYNKKDEYTKSIKDIFKEKLIASIKSEDNLNKEGTKD